MIGSAGPMIRQVRDEEHAERDDADDRIRAAVGMPARKISALYSHH